MPLRGAIMSALCALASIAGAQSPSATVSFDYDNAGNLTKTTDGLQHTTTYGYDALSRRTSATDQATGVTRYTYDALDQLTSVTDARQILTVYTIDGLGNLTQTASGDTGATINTYDEAGNLTSRTDARQQKTTYQYDALDRLTLVTYADNATVVYTYDQGPNAIGRLSRITDSSGSVQYSYDPHGHVTEETRVIGGASHVTAYRYDTAGRLSGMSYPTGLVLEYGRDGAGRINQISTMAGGVATPLLQAVTYQPFGPVADVTFGNGQTQKRNYDLDGRLAGYSLSAHTMAIGYDAANRITAIGNSSAPATGTTYGYDVLDRLTSAIAPTISHGYDYDAVGNRTQKTVNGAPTAYAYTGTGNRLTQAGAQAVATDPNGSITSKGNATFNYDARGRMVSANTAIGVVQYTINSLGQRVRKVTPNDTTVFHYDAGGKLIAETTTTGTVTSTQQYVFLGEMPVAVVK